MSEPTAPRSPRGATGVPARGGPTTGASMTGDGTLGGVRGGDQEAAAVLDSALGRRLDPQEAHRLVSDLRALLTALDERETPGDRALARDLEAATRVLDEEQISG